MGFQSACAEAVAEPTSLTETALVHQRFKLGPADFELFRDVFLETLKQSDEGSEEMTKAWQSTLRPGITYMQAHASTHVE